MATSGIMDCHTAEILGFIINVGKIKLRGWQMVGFRAEPPGTLVITDSTPITHCGFLGSIGHFAGSEGVDSHPHPHFLDSITVVMAKSGRPRIRAIIGYSGCSGMVVEDSPDSDLAAPRSGSKAAEGGCTAIGWGCLGFTGSVGWVG